MTVTRAVGVVRGWLPGLRLQADEHWSSSENNSSGGACPKGCEPQMVLSHVGVVLRIAVYPRLALCVQPKKRVSCERRGIFPLNALAFGGVGARGEAGLHPKGAALRVAGLCSFSLAGRSPSRARQQIYKHPTPALPPSGAAPAVRTHSPNALARLGGESIGGGVQKVADRGACFCLMFLLCSFLGGQRCHAT